MGKGGQKFDGTSSGQKKNLKLTNLSTEELRKWAKAYGLESDLDRDVLLSRLNPLASGILDPLRPANLPLEPPSFTLKTIRDAIPPHCFNRNLFTSLSHLATDLALIYVIGRFFALQIQHAESSLLSLLQTHADLLLPYPSLVQAAIIAAPYLQYILWPIYWFMQGSVMTGVWVLAHECGHQSFSESEFANNLVGTICHSLLLVPYHSWRITHGRHHNNTGSCENDEVFAPATRSDWGREMLRETPLAQLWGIVVMLTVGWMPGYLVFNATGPKKYRNKNANHFSPTAAFFQI